MRDKEEKKCAPISARTTDKTKLKRSRAKYTCDPRLLELLELINQFPPAEAMFDIKVPSYPMKRSDLFRGMHLDLGEEEREFRERLHSYNKEICTVVCRAIADLKFDPETWLLMMQASKFESFFQLGPAFEKTKTELESLFEQVQRDHCDGEKVRLSQALCDELDEKKRTLSRLNVERYAEGSKWAARWLNLYDRIRRIKGLLEELAFVGRDKSIGYDSERLLKHLGSTLNLTGLTPKLYVGTDGKLRRKTDWVIDALVSSDVRRFRKCYICKCFFWAKRIDKKCCQKSCADIFAQRKSCDLKRLNGRQYREQANKKKKMWVSSGDKVRIVSN